MVASEKESIDPRKFGNVEGGFEEEISKIGDLGTPHLR
jgi:hypothetical protein